MTIKTKDRRNLIAYSVACAALLAFANARAQADADEWQYSLTPYIWLPVIDGALNYGPPPGGGGDPNVEVGPTDWLDLLNFAVLVNGSARKGNFVIFSDFVYLSMETTDSSVLSVDDTNLVAGALGLVPVDASLALGTKSELDGVTWTIAAGYQIENTSTSTMNAFAGVRYFGVDVSTRWNLTTEITTPGGTTVLPAQGSVSGDVDLWDGVIGVRGHFDLTSEKLSVPYYLDVGTGQSELTWQAMAGISWAFGWGDLLVLYRHLEYDEGSGDLMQSFSFSGPVVGARFNF